MEPLSFSSSVRERKTLITRVVLETAESVPPP
jgi:hypothetical protein